MPFSAPSSLSPVGMLCRFEARYSEPQVQKARALFERSDQHVRAVMVGAALSTAVYDVLTQGPDMAGVCQLCHSSVSTSSMCVRALPRPTMSLLHALDGRSKAHGRWTAPAHWMAATRAAVLSH